MPSCRNEYLEVSPSDLYCSEPDISDSYIIIGSGVFGASTAYHLAKNVTPALITLLDRAPFPCPLAASYDYQKVIRSDYANPFHMRLATMAQKAWKSDPLWSPYYHESGIVKIEQGNLGRQMVDNWKKIGMATKAHITDAKTIQAEFPLFRDAAWDAAEDCYVNPECGWADAAAALDATIQAAVDLGVRYVDKGAVELLFEYGGNRCCGVKTGDGDWLRAAHIILATGSNTAQFLANSNPHCPEMQLGDLLLGAGVVTGAIKLTEQQADHFKNMPMFMHRVGGILGEVYPPTKDRILKFTRDGCFTNKYAHPRANVMVSAPPSDRPDERQNQCPKKLRDEIAVVMEGIFGKEMAGFEIDSYRICWDAVTPDRDFLISPHPNCPGLYLATGGSFHGWKFLPIIGQYVVQMLQGTLDKDLARRWGCDRQPDPDMPEYQKPQRDWKDFQDEAETAQGTALQITAANCKEVEQGTETRRHSWLGSLLGSVKT